MSYRDSTLTHKAALYFVLLLALTASGAIGAEDWSGPFEIAPVSAPVAEVAAAVEAATTYFCEFDV